MHTLLEKLLKKRGINNVNDLNTEEKAQFDTWQSQLSEGEITVKRISDFCQLQLDIIKAQMKGIDNSPAKNERLTIYFNIYDTLLNLINSPQAERESLVKYLEQLTK